MSGRREYFRRREQVRKRRTPRPRLLRKGEEGRAASTAGVRSQRPTSRVDCADGPRPCPWVGCRHHLYLEVTSQGDIKLNHPDRRPNELMRSCALDEAAHGGLTLEEVAKRLNVTRERVRQIESEALRKLKRKHSKELREE